jgi:hypothetical protein
MATWHDAVNRFLAEWRIRPEVAGALVCGSYVTGGATARSDVDVHLVLHHDTPWRERGNRIVDGYLVEYFANTPACLRAEFRDDYKANSWMSMVQFTTGEILFDTNGDIATLRKEAADWILRPFGRLDDPAAVAGMRYSLWDTLDNLRDSAARKSPDLQYVYHHCIADAYRMYARYLGWHIAGSHQHLRLLCDGEFRARYGIPAFPDEVFAALFSGAFRAATAQEMLLAAERLVTHVIERMGGLTIDGWTQREPVPG